MNISVEEAKNKIEELRVDIKQLVDEKEKYRKYIIDMTNKDLFAARKKYDGKYFLQKTTPKKEDYDHIKAFKVIKVTKENKYYAECLALVEDDRPSTEDTVGVVKTNICLWCRNTNDVIYNKSTPYIMDCYEEISKEEFLELYKKKMDILDEYI